MSGLEFTASLVGSLAWPVVVLIGVLVFHDQLTALLARPFSSVKAGPFTVEWERGVAKTEANLTAQRRTLPVDPTEQQVAAFVEIAPGTVIERGFGQVEARLREMLRDAGIANPTVPGSGLATEALRAGLISPEMARSIDGLVVLRNLAIHGRGELTAARAQEFAALADGVLYALQATSPPAPRSGG